MQTGAETEPHPLPHSPSEPQCDVPLEHPEAADAGGLGRPIPPALTAFRQLGEPVVSLVNITKEFKLEKSTEVVVALRDVSLVNEGGSRQERLGPTTYPSVRRGEFLIIRGPSGGGKSTLLNIIGTIDTPTSGYIELFGEKIADNTDEALATLRLQHIGFVFQTFNLISTMSALENVELPMTLLSALDAKAIRRRAKQLLTLVGLRNRINHLPSELSGGEQQRVTIARALANNPSMLLLDEPTGDLDTATTIEVMDLIYRINRMTGTTCIMVTHNPDIECYADRILFVEDGRLMRQIINTEPFMLEYDVYMEYLRGLEQASPSAAAVAA